MKQPPAQPPPVKAAAAGSVARSASTLDTDLLGLSLGAAASPSAVPSSSSANDLLGEHRIIFFHFFIFFICHLKV